MTLGPMVCASIPFRRAKLKPRSFRRALKRSFRNIPLRRLGQPEEVAKAIYFLCTDASSYVSGAELHINGGQHV